MHNLFILRLSSVRFTAHMINKTCTKISRFNVSVTVTVLTVDGIASQISLIKITFANTNNCLR